MPSSGFRSALQIDLCVAVRVALCVAFGAAHSLVLPLVCLPIGALCLPLECASACQSFLHEVILHFVCTLFAPLLHLVCLYLCLLLIGFIALACAVGVPAGTVSSG